MTFGRANFEVEMGVWLIVECENCGGSGWNYCWNCDGRCDHDKICSKCDGYGQIPEKQSGFKAFVAQTFEHFNSKIAANDWIRRE